MSVITHNNPVTRLRFFFEERNRIWMLRHLQKPWPWTKDEILQKYKFCNVYRELDRTTVWLRKNWYDTNAADPHLWFAATVARHVNLLETLEEIGYPVPWSPEKFRAVIDRRMADSRRSYSAAYMIRADNARPKHVYLAEDVFSPLWAARRELGYRSGELLVDFHARLLDCHGLGSFMAGQIIADAKFCGDMLGAPDWWTFSVPGPGSLRGLNRVLDRDPRSPWEPGEWGTRLTVVTQLLNAVAGKNTWPRVSAQDAQNTLCEWDKYERTRLGQGRPKQNYKRPT